MNEETKVVSKQKFKHPHPKNFRRGLLDDSCSHAVAIEKYAERFCEGMGVDYGYGHGKGQKEHLSLDSIGIDTGIIKHPDGKEHKDTSINHLNFAGIRGLDYIFSSHKLQTIREWKETLIYWHSILSWEGVLFLYLPHENVEEWLPVNCPSNVWVPSWEVLIPFLEQIGFDIVEYQDDMDKEGSFYIVAIKNNGY